MEYLIYISTAKHLLDEDELIAIYNVSRNNNKVHGVTGVLLYSEGTFIQLLEGEADAVKHLFESIAKDERHKNIIKLAHDVADHRAFPEWTMGFKTLKHTEMKELEGYFNPSEFHFNESSNHPGMDIIKTFMDSH